MNRALLVAIVILIRIVSGVLAVPKAQEQNPGPKLLLFIVVDQMRADYLERFRGGFQGGLKHILERGVSFDNAHHAHAVTNTGPGHTALSTGVYPGRAGIISNEWYDRSLSKIVYCVSQEDSPILSVKEETWPPAGRGPANLLVTALGDWLKKASPDSKVFTASRKDRAAILLGGRRPDGAYWITPKTGQFVTSRYYRREYPKWLSEFRRRGIPSSYFGKAWRPIVPSGDGAGGGIRSSNPGARSGRFPHFLGRASLAPDETFYKAFSSSPFVDEYLTEFAIGLLEHEEIGSDETVDMLALSYSALDLVGHDYGPHSPELFDTVLRLDRTLGRLLDFIDRRIGLERVVISLSSDHGVVDLPEGRRARSESGSRTGVKEVVCIQQAGLKLIDKFGPGPWFEAPGYLNYQLISERKLDRQAVAETLAGWLEACPSVRKVWLREKLQASGSAASADAALYRNSFHPWRSPDFKIQYRKYHLTKIKPGTTHGTPYSYDTHVPMLLVVPGWAPGSFPGRVRTVDLAPTLARILSIAPPADLDGRDLGPLLR